MHMVYPALVYLQLTRPIVRDAPIPDNWRTFVDQGTITRVRTRLGLDRRERMETK